MKMLRNRHFQISAGEVCSRRGLDFQPFVQDQFGKPMSLSAVYDLWHDLGDEWLVPRSKPRKSDPEVIVAFQKKSPQNSRRFKPHIPTNRSSPAFKTSADSVNKGR